METKDVLDMILESKLIAIVRGIPYEKMENTARALKEGGIRCLEVTFDPKDPEKSKDTLRSIELLARIFDGQIAIGAGTVLTQQNVLDAKRAGAQYIISPNVDATVIEETKRQGLISIPGALTPTEVVEAHRLGADIVKLFPAGILGLEYIKAVMGPLTHIPLTAVGGIDEKNAKTFIDAGCVGVGVGGNLVNKKLILADQFDELTELARKYQL